MADYWVSQAKKYCDFCKCWIADNKPSIEFHEKGKRHKENVIVRLKDIGKKSAKQHKEMVNVDQEMKKMEEAALKAYMKDVEANADFTSQIIKQQMAEKERQAAEDKDEKEKEKEKAAPKLEDLSDKEEPPKKDKMWLEAVSDEGYTYYWHSETGESVWEPPEEGFRSLAEQKEEEEREAERKAKEEKKALKLKERKEKEEEKQRLEEQRAWVEREKMRSRRVKDDDKKEEKKDTDPLPVIGPAPRIDPYGGWTKVEFRDEEPTDLQLPQVDYEVISLPSISEPQVKFKEKTVTRLTDEDGGSSSFKKRKFNSNNKRSMRQRLDDD